MERRGRHERRDRARLLDRPTFAVLEAEQSPLGCVATLAAGVVHLSNVRGPADAWPEVVGAVAGTFPGRPIVGYERGAGLEAALEVGFEALGTTRIWVG